MYVYYKNDEDIKIDTEIIKIINKWIKLKLPHVINVNDYKNLRNKIIKLKEEIEMKIKIKKKVENCEIDKYY